MEATKEKHKVKSGDEVRYGGRVVNVSYVHADNTVNLVALKGASFQSKHTPIADLEFPNEDGNFAVMDVEPEVTVVTPPEKPAARRLEIKPKVAGDQTIIFPMSKIEAQSLVNQIRSGFNTIADKLLQLEQREGWKALGYANWRECVTAEFNFSQSRVYQLLAFAEVQQNVSTVMAISTNGGKAPIEINERQARELAKVPAEQQAVILEKAIETSPKGKPSAAHIKRTIETETIKTETKVDVIDPETGEILNKPLLKPETDDEPEAASPVSTPMPEVIADLTDYLMNHGWFTSGFQDGVMTSKHLSGAEMIVTLKVKELA